jgi:hypothetical protein
MSILPQTFGWILVLMKMCSGMRNLRSCLLGPVSWNEVINSSTFKSSLRHLQPGCQCHAVFLRATDRRSSDLKNWAEWDLKRTWSLMVNHPPSTISCATVSHPAIFLFLSLLEGGFGRKHENGNCHRPQMPQNAWFQLLRGWPSGQQNFPSPDFRSPR